MGYSRDAFYRFRELYDKSGQLALQEISRKKPILRNHVEAHIEEAVIKLATDNPALERKKVDQEVKGEIETYHPGYLGAQDTYYVGSIKGVGRIYQQTFIPEL